MGNTTNDLLSSPEIYDQVEVMHRASRIPTSERSPHYSLLMQCLVADGVGNVPMVRAAQIAAAWLPSSLPLVLSAIEFGSDEARFAIICALTDAPMASLHVVQDSLVPAILHGALASDDSDIAYISAQALVKFESLVVWTWLESIKSSHGPENEAVPSVFFASQLRDSVFCAPPWLERIELLLQEWV